MKVMTIVGTRPEIIRLSRVITRLDSTFEHVLVHTGQNYDYELNEIFSRDLELREPDHYLAVDTSSLGRTLGDILAKTEQVLIGERPDAVLLLGDTNSCLAGIIAKRMHIPVYHMEAGNRCFDENVPEETNRRLIDHAADFNLVYTEHARRNLLAEGLHPQRILLTGSPMKEVIDHYGPRFSQSTALKDLGLAERQYVVASIHREENVDHPDRLRLVLDCLAAVHEHFGMPIVMSTHPRTRNRLADLNRNLEGVVFHPPFGFLDYGWLQTNAFCVMSDSGTISEESSILGFAAVTLRESIERPEALDAGSILMTGLNAADVVAAIGIATKQIAEPDRPSVYDIDNCSARVTNFIASTCHRHAAWAGIRPAGPPVTGSGERQAPG